MDANTLVVKFAEAIRMIRKYKAVAKELQPLIDKLTPGTYLLEKEILVIRRTQKPKGGYCNESELIEIPSPENKPEYMKTA